MNYFKRSYLVGRKDTRFQEELSRKVPYFTCGNYVCYLNPVEATLQRRKQSRIIVVVGIIFPEGPIWQLERGSSDGQKVK